MIDLKCPECGCTVPPDAARCPNCSYKYADGAAKVPPKSNGNGITVSCVGFVTRGPQQDTHPGQRDLSAYSVSILLRHGVRSIGKPCNSSRIRWGTLDGSRTLL